MMTLRLGLFIAYTIIILVGHTNYDGDYKGTTGVAVGYFFIWLMGFSIFFAFKNNSDSSVSATPQLKKCPHWPSLQLLHDYADHPLYIKALANSVRTQWDKQGERRHLVFSYHGIPKRYVTNGDPYARRCETTSRLVAEELELGDHEWTHVYQSRFGREEWLKPYADATLKAMPSMGIKKSILLVLLFQSTA